MGIMLLAIAWIGAIVISHQAWSYVGLLGAIPVVLSLVGKRSPGAVDNASGVATVLTAAPLLPQSVGILVTDAEELGLAGARAWCNQNLQAAVLNCDGIDDSGPLTLMWTRPRARRLEQAFRIHQRLRVMPLVPGVLVDAKAFSDAGWEAITLSRGTLGTLRRIHTARDDLDRLKGSGIESAARLLAAAAISLTE
jgi:hypothetical protein